MGEVGDDSKTFLAKKFTPLAPKFSEQTKLIQVKASKAATKVFPISFICCILSSIKNGFKYTAWSKKKLS